MSTQIILPLQIRELTTYNFTIIKGLHSFMIQILTHFFMPDTFTILLQTRFLLLLFLPLTLL